MAGWRRCAAAIGRLDHGRRSRDACWTGELAPDTNHQRRRAVSREDVSGCACSLDPTAARSARSRVVASRAAYPETTWARPEQRSLRAGDPRRRCLEPFQFAPHARQPRLLVQLLDLPIRNDRRARSLLRWRGDHAGPQFSSLVERVATLM